MSSLLWYEIITRVFIKSFIIIVEHTAVPPKFHLQTYIALIQCANHAQYNYITFAPLNPHDSWPPGPWGMALLAKGESKILGRYLMFPKFTQIFH